MRFNEGEGLKRWIEISIHGRMLGSWTGPVLGSYRRLGWQISTGSCCCFEGGVGVISSV